MHDEIAQLADAVDAFGASQDYARYLACLHAGRMPDVAALLHAPIAHPDDAAQQDVLYAHACVVAARHGLAVHAHDALPPHQSGRVVGNAVLVSAHAPHAVLLDAVVGAVAARWLTRQGVTVDPTRAEAYAAVAAHLTLRAIGVERTTTARELALRGVMGLLVRAAAPYGVAAATHILHSLHEASDGQCGRPAPLDGLSLPRPLGPGVEEALWASLQTCDHLHIVLAAEPLSPGETVIQRAADEAHAVFASALERVATGRGQGHAPDPDSACRVGPICRGVTAREVG